MKQDFQILGQSMLKKAYEINKKLGSIGNQEVKTDKI